MMDRKFFVAGMVLLGENFTQPAPTEGRFDAYYAHLSDLSTREWELAVGAAMRGCERPFFPTVATLRRLAGRLLTWGDVYERIVKLLRHWPVGAPPKRLLHPFDAFVIQRLGGWQRLTNGEDDTWIRRDIERDAEGWQQDAVKRDIPVPGAREQIAEAPKGGFAQIGDTVIPLQGTTAPQLEGPVEKPVPSVAERLAAKIGKPIHSADWRPVRPKPEPRLMTAEEIAARKAQLAAQGRMLKAGGYGKPELVVDNT